MKFYIISMTSLQWARHPPIQYLSAKPKHCQGNIFAVRSPTCNGEGRRAHNITLLLGINIDTEKMEARLPDDKLDKVRRLVHTWLHKRKARKRDILSLVGLLQHATKIVRSGRTFVSRMYATAAKLKKMHYFTRLNRDFHSDLAWWHVFIHSWNGLSLLCCVSTVSPAFTVYTDASGFWGCGTCCGTQWLQWKWPQEWFPMSIMAKELVPIVFSRAVWGPQLSG